MKRIIEFYKDENNYIFKENQEKKIEISVTEKILNGLDLYNNFFKEFSLEDSFELVDKTNEDVKKNDKVCIAIFTKVKELFSNIEKSLKIELAQNADANELNIINK